jgi:hypothetical protein
MPETKTRTKRDNLYAFDNLIVTMHRSPLGTAWRWRTELSVLTVLIAALAALSFISPVSWLAVHSAALIRITSCPRWVSDLTWGAAELAATLTALLGIPEGRRFIMARVWCVLARHRFQRLCWEARLHTRSGRLPAVLWVHPTRVGERLTVWCRAGVASEDFEKHTGELRAACYARDARVTRNPRWSQLVTIDIIRRDTLAASHQVSTPLARLTLIYAQQLAGQEAQLTEPETSPGSAEGGGPPVIPGEVVNDDESGTPPAWPDRPGLDNPPAA